MKRETILPPLATLAEDTAPFRGQSAPAGRLVWLPRTGTPVPPQRRIPPREDTQTRDVA